MSPVRAAFLGYFALLLGCAFIGVAISVDGGIVDEVRLAYSFALTFVCGGAAYSAAALIARRDLLIGAGAVAIFEPIAFVVGLDAIWGADLTYNSADWAATFVVIAVACLFLTTLRLMIDRSDAVVRAVFFGSVLCEAIAAGAAIDLIWGNPGEWSYSTVEIATAFSVLATFGFLFTPALARYRQAVRGAP